jgi:hypothetical protein
VSKNSISLEFSDLDLALHLEAIVDALDEVVPLLSKLIEAELTWTQLSEEEQESRLHGHLAMGLSVRGCIALAVEKSKAMQEFLLGNIGLSDIGFPEFLKGSNLDD